MPFGNLGEPDLTIKDMSTLTQLGGVKFIDDGMGGLAALSDAAGARVQRSGGIFNSVDDRFWTYVAAFKIPAISANGFIAEADIGGANRNTQLVCRAAGDINAVIVSGTGGGAEEVDTVNTYDDNVISLAIHTFDFGLVANHTDHVHKIYAGPIFGTLEDITDSQSADILIWTSLSNIAFCANNATGGEPLPNNAWVGQIRSWFGNDASKFCDLADALAIKEFYRALLSGGVASSRRLMGIG